MNLAILTPGDWNDFKTKHPSAYAFLLYRCLVGERVELKRLKLIRALTAWEEKRLEELQSIEK